MILLSQGGGGVGDAYPDLVAREQKLQSDVLKLSEENLSLRFEMAQAQQEMPRLKVHMCKIWVLYHLTPLFISQPIKIW